MFQPGRGILSGRMRPPALVLLILAVRDLPAMRAFYVDALGWAIQVDLPVYVELHHPDGARLGLYAEAGFAANVGEAPAPRVASGVSRTELYLHADELDAAIARAVAAGARLLSPRAPRSWGDDVAYLADPEGNVIALHRALDAPAAIPEDARLKQVIVIRKDLKMRRGKEIAQGAHASMAWLTRRLRAAGGRAPRFSAAEQGWLTRAFRKVTVQVSSEDELRGVHQRAVDAGLESHLIIDSGATEFHGQPTPTACGIGPDLEPRIDAITGGLGLY